ncbi:protein disulfide oxidoreductase [Microbulbifer guangxiensis]|uniref:protein disulfide oxidoreductase n=1 Tax=Microbulbifer guangxiensis TaxID=2904249 RepID=UPI001F426FBC|nr:protein disulfide oxidoreductase [Microbulbifer guangxiensis]
MSRKWLATLRQGAVFLVLLTVLVTAVGLYQQRDIPRGRLPPLMGKTLGGDAVDLVTLTDRGPVLLYFWATWCGYCRIVSPMVDELAADHQVLTVALQSGSDTEVADYLTDKGWSLPTLNDPSGALSGTWGVRVTPTLVILNSAGEVAWVTSGTTSKWGLQLRLALTN